MKYEAKSPAEYISLLTEDRQNVISGLRKTILKNLPEGFEECINYETLGYVVPHLIYPSGYHCSPKLPLPFMNLASQKNFVAVYHMGMYADEKLYHWFLKEYPEHCKRKLDMGKSCIRFKYMHDIPYDLIGELASKMTVDAWISLYEKNVKR